MVLVELSRLDPSDTDSVNEALVFDNLARSVDTPWEPPRLLAAYLGDLLHSWDDDPGETYLYRSGGSIIGRLQVHFPRWDNHHTADLGVLVHPEYRRRGLGSELVDAGLSFVRQKARSTLFASSPDDPGFMTFAARMGFTQAGVDVDRKQDLHAVDWEDIARLVASAETASTEYSMLRFPGPVPADMLADVATMVGAINDAPTDDFDVEDEVYPPERVRALENSLVAWDRRWYRLIARHNPTGELAGHTLVCIDNGRADWGYQYDTAVVRAHRGHRLGLRLKAAMMQWLHAEEPGLRWVVTDNAESNAHMIAVNEQLGYEVVARWIGYQRKL